MATQHGSNLPAGVLAEVERLEGERRDLDTSLRQRIQGMIDAARREGFDVGFRAGKQTVVKSLSNSLVRIAAFGYNMERFRSEEILDLGGSINETPTID
jgi:hypothetical protein